MATVICQGCGQAFELSEGYARNKIQCPGCGVICPVPAETTARRGRSAAPPAREVPRPEPAALEEEAAAWLNEAPEAPAPLRERPPSRAEPESTAVEPVAPERTPEAKLFACRRCGQLVRRQRECPVCDAEGEGILPAEPEAARPATASAAVVGLAPHSLELDEPAAPGAAAEDEEEPSPYLLAGPALPRCPKCHRDLPALGAVVCVACGFNLRTRKKASRSYDPIARSWVSEMSLANRLMWVGAFQGFHLLLTIGAGLNGHVTPFLVAWVPLTAIVCFVLGTYDRIELTRDTRGRVTLTKHWRFCFFPIAPKVTEVQGFEGVVIGQWNDTGVWEWLVFVSLLFLGIIPALIWWYNTIYKNYFHVALARDHGHAEVYVFRGRSEEQMHDIARALCEATGLRNIS